MFFPFSHCFVFLGSFLFHLFSNISKALKTAKTDLDIQYDSFMFIFNVIESANF